MKSITLKWCRVCGERKDPFSFSKPKNVCDDCRDKSQRRNKYPAFIYLICGASLTKIGIARDPEDRKKTLNIGSPVDLSLIYSFWTEDSRLIEGILHKMYKNKWIKGERFNLSEGDINWIMNNY